MFLTGSVGFKGKNHPNDAKLVQTLFNLNRGRFTNVTPRRLVVDGLVGQKTTDALVRFQREVMGVSRAHTLTADHDATMQALVAEQDATFSKDKLAAVMPQASQDLIDRYFGPLVETMNARGIDTPLRRSHFLAQLAHESGSLRFSEELASGAAYEGRDDLGNTEPGDGRRFKGRGLIQLTGRANYTRYSAATGVDYVSRPELLSTRPTVAADVAGWFWGENGLNEEADRDDITTVSKIINGGYNGLADRIDALHRALCVFGAV